MNNAFSDLSGEFKVNLVKPNQREQKMDYHGDEWKVCTPCSTFRHDWRVISTSAALATAIDAKYLMSCGRNKPKNDRQ